MRMAFGLVSLLVCVAIMMLMMSQEIGPHGPVRQGLKAQDEIRPLSAEGYHEARDSIVVEPVDNGGKLTALNIKSIVAGGPMQKYFGLQQGDKVIEIAELGRVRDIADQEMAEAQLFEAYQRQKTIVVDRDGERVILPSAGGGASPSAAGGGASSVNNTLKSLQSIPTH